MFRLNKPFAALALFASATSSFAASISFTGTFFNDTDVQLFTFTLNADTPGVTLRTFSYAGGVNADGASIAPGGFDTHLSLFAANGDAMNPGLSGCSLPGNPLPADPITQLCADTYYPTTDSFPGGIWSAGTYIVALSEDANAAVGNLSDGFFANAVLGLTSPANFTCQLPPEGGFQSGPTFPIDGAFCDNQTATDTLRNGHWALDILNVDSATQDTAAPEASTISFALIGIAVIAACRRSHRREPISDRGREA
jgi:hypothetical protein